MKKTFLVLAVLFYLIGQTKLANASAIPNPTCFVSAEVINVGSEMRRLDTGKEYESYYIDLKISEVNKKEACSIEIGQVYRAIDSSSGVLKIGDKVSSAISFSSSMGPAGPSSFLQWSNLTFENGSPIKNGNNVIIDFLQSGQVPLEQLELELAQQAAERDLPKFLKAAWMDSKENYGFKADDKIEEVKLAKPISIYGINEEKVKEMKDTLSLISVIDFSGSWFFPVEVKGEYRTLFLVTQQGDKSCKGSSLGNFDLANRLQKLRHAWSSDGDDNFLYVTCFNPHSSLFILTSISDPNLTPLTWVGLGEKDGLAPPEDLSSWMPAEKVISRLKEFWSKGLKWGPFGGEQITQ